MRAPIDMFLVAGRHVPAQAQHFYQARHQSGERRYACVCVTGAQALATSQPTVAPDGSSHGGDGSERAIELGGSVESKLELPPNRSRLARYCAASFCDEPGAGRPARALDGRMMANKWWLRRRKSHLLCVSCERVSLVCARWLPDLLAGWLAVSASAEQDNYNKQRATATKTGMMTGKLAHCPVGRGAKPEATLTRL